MRIGIVGSREPNLSYEEFVEIIDGLLKENKLYPTIIVSGGATGIDSYAARFATDRGLKLVEFKPDYSKDGRGATLARNTRIVDYSDAIVALPFYNSHGTYDTINKARKKGKKTVVRLLERD